VCVCARACTRAWKRVCVCVCACVCQGVRSCRVIWAAGALQLSDAPLTSLTWACIGSSTSPPPSFPFLPPFVHDEGRILLLPCHFLPSHFLPLSTPPLLHLPQLLYQQQWARMKLKKHSTVRKCIYICICMYNCSFHITPIDTNMCCVHKSSEPDFCLSSPPLLWKTMSLHGGHETFEESFSVRHNGEVGGWQVGIRVLLSEACLDVCPLCLC